MRISFELLNMSLGSNSLRTELDSTVEITAWDQEHY